MKPVKMVVAGCANPHIAGYLKGIRNITKYVHVAAVSDRLPAYLERARVWLGEGSGVAFYSDFRQMLDEHPETEAILVGSDNADHFEIYREAFRRGLHIYSMKVVSMDPAECAELRRLQATSSRIFQVELELRFQPQFQYARELVRSGKLGKIHSISLSNISQSPICCYPNWGNPELSYGRRVELYPGARRFRGGALTDHPHPFDLVHWITERRFSRVSAFSAKNQRDYLEVEDHLVLTGELDDGVKVMINPSYSNLEERTETRRLLWPKSLECNLKITGEHGYYAADYFDQSVLVLGAHHASPNRLIVETTPAPGGTPLLVRFVENIRGTSSPGIASLEDGVAAVQVMNAAYDSLARGCPVDVRESAGEYGG